ncbi:MAG: hypothetical protein MI806_20725, partial [Minwuiales bacterium]|nr:hypothetical protein [Minwuiales bacterium]
FAWLDPRPLAAAPAEVGLRALARLLMTVGGREYTPRLERLERLHERISGGLERGATLGVCRLVPRRGQILVVREAAGMDTCPVRPGARLLWDGRFEITVRARGRGTRSDLTLGPLGRDGWAEVCAAVPELRRSPIPAPARPALPSLRDAAGVAAVPHLAYRRGGGDTFTLGSCRFAPIHGLAERVFTVA